ncbi:DsbA family protein [Acetobacter sp. AN02]|uniref:DsbA family protein n=1 Tax=Acetobacter sp. AN02 TaxID=2894186 RepID=UPI0024342CB0|nr:DsbA family protein [Acetobacter sp. AN02]MDG6094597.1 DsbA family protein [Acetobacter sp. AN02]
MIFSGKIRLRKAALFVLLAEVAVSTMLVTRARAGDTFSPGQRQEIVEIVRQALRNDPSILTDAVEAMHAKSEQQQKAGALKVAADEHARLGGSSTDVVLGNPAGSLEVVEFYDPRCPYCRKVLPDLDSIVKEEPQLKLVEKVIPVLGPASQLEAKALLAAARQDGYLKLQHVLMNDTQQPSQARIRQLAASVGLDADRLEKDMEGPDVAAAMRENIALAKKLEIEGTPTFLIGTQEVIPGAASREDLLREIRKLKK